MPTITISDKDFLKVRNIIDEYYETITTLYFDNNATKEVGKEGIEQANGLIKTLGLDKIDKKDLRYDLIGHPGMGPTTEGHNETASGKYKLAYDLIITNKDENNKEPEYRKTEPIYKLGIEIPDSQYDNNKPDESYNKLIDLMNSLATARKVYDECVKRGLINKDNVDRVELTIMVGSYNPYGNIYNEHGFNTIEPQELYGMAEGNDLPMEYPQEPDDEEPYDENDYKM